MALEQLEKKKPVRTDLWGSEKETKAFEFSANGILYVASAGTHHVFVYAKNDPSSKPSFMIQHSKTITTKKEFKNAINNSDRFKLEYKAYDTTTLKWV